MTIRKLPRELFRKADVRPGGQAEDVFRQCLPYGDPTVIVCPMFESHLQHGITLFFMQEGLSDLF